jgi:hypothetical protein
LPLAQIRSPAAPSVEFRTMEPGTFLRLEKIDCA